MPLRGIKVIEIAGLAPAPFCGMVLADFGASVIRVDRLTPTMPDVLSNGKKSIALNLKKEQGVEILKKLCEKSDVLIEPFRRGVMEKLGLGPSILMKQNPRLIYARLTGFGQNGYYADRAGHDINYLATSGLLSMFKRKGEKPLAPCNVIADFGGGGLTCALGIVLALFERERSNLGQIIDSNMVEGSSYLGSWIYRGKKDLPIWNNPPGENQLDSGAFFYDTYETKDHKYMSVGALEPQFFEKFIEGLSLQDQISQFDDNDKCKQIIKDKFLEKTQKEWCAIFDQIDACVAPVLSLDEAPVFKHNTDRNSFIKDDDIFIPKPSPILTRTPGETKNSRPGFGEHTIEILKSLNFNNNDIENLNKNQVIKLETNSKL